VFGDHHMASWAVFWWTRQRRGSLENHEIS
jgi:hypothetical protein